MKSCKLLQRIIYVTTAIFLIAMIAGCVDSNPPATEPTVPDYSQEPGQEDGYIHSHPMGTTVRYDLNGDGVGEDITVNTNEFEVGNLTIGNATVEIWSATPTGYFTILNVDASSDTLMVGISDYGPSDDPETLFYAYDGTSIREIGYLTDIFGKNIYDHNSTICHGDGTVTARKRWDVLGTWNSVGLYKVSENGIEDITEFYPYIDWDGQFAAWEVTSKMELPMYDLNGPDAAVTVPAGMEMAMTGLRRGEGNNLYWVTFEVESMGKTLGMTVERIDWYTCVYTGGGFVTSEEAFDGFFYAG